MWCNSVRNRQHIITKQMVDGRSMGITAVTIALDAAWGQEVEPFGPGAEIGRRSRAVHGSCCGGVRDGAKGDLH